MNDFASNIGSVGFQHIKDSEPKQIVAAINYLVHKLQLAVECGYLAQFWQENTQFSLGKDAYFGDWTLHQPAQNAFNQYYRFDPTTGHHGARSFHNESTLFKYLLKGRRQPLEPHPIENFFLDKHRVRIAEELRDLLKKQNVHRFGPVFFVPFVGQEGHYYIAMLKFPESSAHTLAMWKSQVDLLASLIGFATFSTGIRPPVLLGTPEYMLFTWIGNQLRDMIEGMHDTVLHTLRVTHISQRILLQCEKDGCPFVNRASKLRLHAAAMVHDFGKHYSVKGPNNLEDIADTIDNWTRDVNDNIPIMDIMGARDKIESSLRDLHKLFKHRKEVQARYDQHPLYSSRDVFKGVNKLFADTRHGERCLMDNNDWKRWLIPVICHHFIDKGNERTDEAAEYLDHIGLKSKRTVTEVYEAIPLKEKFLVCVLALADRIEDDAGFKWHRQTRKGPKEAIQEITTSDELRAQFGEGLIQALCKCTNAVISVYHKGIDL